MKEAAAVVTTTADVTAATTDFVLAVSETVPVPAISSGSSSFSPFSAMDAEAAAVVIMDAATMTTAV